MYYCCITCTTFLQFHCCPASCRQTFVEYTRLAAVYGIVYKYRNNCMYLLMYSITIYCLILKHLLQLVVVKLLISCMSVLLITIISFMFLYMYLYVHIIIIESVDSISRDEPDSPLTQYITNSRISRVRYTITLFKHHHRVLRLISNRISV